MVDKPRPKHKYLQNTVQPKLKNKTLFKRNKDGSLRIPNKNRFWDDENQRIQGWKYAKRHGLNYTDPIVQEQIRVLYRDRQGREQVHGWFRDWHGRIIATRDGLPIEHIDDVPEDLREGIIYNWNETGKEDNPASTFRKNKTRLQKYLDVDGDNGNESDDEEPEVTYRTWHGDYISWYVFFIMNDFNFPSVIPLGKCHEQWATEIEEGRKIVHLDPRDHYKTWFIGIGYTLYNLCEHGKKILTSRETGEKKNIKGKGLCPALVISWSGELAGDTMGAIVRNLRENPRILKYYGYLLDDRERPATQDKIFLKTQPKGAKDPALFSTSLQSGRITGTHPKLAILDDIEETYLTEKYMKKARQMIDMKLIPALGKDGKLIIIGTIKGWTAENDVYLWLKKKPTFRYYIHPAATDMPPMDKIFCEIRKRVVIEDDHPMLDSKGNVKYEDYFYIELLMTDEEKEKYKPLYPERYSIEDLIEKRIELREQKKKTDDVFWSEYFLRATDPAGKFFDKTRLGYFPTPAFPTVKSLVEWTHTENYHTFMWIDPGGKGKGTAIVIAILIDGNFYAIQMRKVKAGIMAIAQTVAHDIVEYNVQVWGCEGNFDQAETYANTIDREVYRILDREGHRDLYTNVVVINAKGEKMLRISTVWTHRLGYKGSPIQCFVNQHAEAYDDFNNEFTIFGDDPKLPYDLLDAGAAVSEYLIGRAAFVFWESGKRTSPLLPQTQQNNNWKW